MFSNAGAPPRRIVNILAAIFILFVLVYLFPHDFRAQDAHISPLSSGEGKFAYATFLGGRADGNETSPTDDDDKYFTQTRMLLWQLKHDPATRSVHKHPFIVAVTGDIKQPKKKILESEGAIVKEVAKVQPLDHKKGASWVNAVTKLRLFELTEYEKIVYLSPDHLITRPLDDIFDDTAAQVQQNKKLAVKGATKAAEGPQPSTYLLASTSSAMDYGHKLPTTNRMKMGGDIILFTPSKELYNYYVSLAALKAKGKKGAYTEEEQLWNYAHRKKGNMPWAPLQWKWNIDYVSYQDYEAGVASLKVKYWEIPEEDAELRKFALGVKQRMEEYWSDKEKGRI